ncbi:hypothetical protein SR870_04420 [Rhodopseudomonas palustris]|uniref:hypothetical protein n=1 Tax=Rhodopseudomonas palustris TaxID=1076 RepID=UPI002ACDEAE6|nr:hypothetical protein [Rhodopseudomonas palustris]WQH02178.1 hypothetical protein SR870_04420 [Rhodopseudomonas palustris]
MGIDHAQGAPPLFHPDLIFADAAPSCGIPIDEFALQTGMIVFSLRVKSISKKR